MIDSGAGGNFIDQNYARTLGLPLLPLPSPIRVHNVDGTLNKKGTVTKYVETHINLGKRKDPIRLNVTGLGNQKVILGYPWLKESNPVIDWKQGEVRWNEETIASLIPENEEDLSLLLAYVQDNEENPEEIFINAKTSASQKLSWKHDTKNKKPLEEMIPKEYHEYLDLFSKEASDRLPPLRPWDHEIKIKPRREDGKEFEPKSCKVYPLTPQEEEATRIFIQENLKKGYIRESQSPMASSFFYVNKKDADSLRPCQDYRYINEWTVKNAYPLPLVTDLLDKLKGAKFFTKLDI